MIFFDFQKFKLNFFNSNRSPVAIPSARDLIALSVIKRLLYIKDK